MPEQPETGSIQPDLFSYFLFFIKINYFSQITLSIISVRPLAGVCKAWEVKPLLFPGSFPPILIPCATNPGFPAQQIGLFLRNKKNFVSRELYFPAVENKISCAGK
jgi:hypothetical protein